MSRTPSAVAALLFAIAPSAFGVCALHLRFDEGAQQLVWDNVPGAAGYQIQESFDEMRTSRNYSASSPPFAVKRRLSSSTPAWYAVTAFLPASILSISASSDACTEQIQVRLKPDPAFRALTRKVVVPIVGSGPGANGGRFKTSIHLLATSAQETGRLIFHPAGIAATPNDPFIRYSLDAGGSEMQIDDVVAAMGQNGIGSLDVVPDESATDVVPIVEARLFNDTSSGTFGTTTGAFLPFDFLHPPDLSLKVPPADAPYRINIGLRTLTETKATVLIYEVSGHVKDLRNLSWPADYMTLGSISQILGIDLQPGESLTFFFDGAVIPFYTRTENRTNDPELFIPTRPRSTDLSSFVE